MEKVIFVYQSPPGRNTATTDLLRHLSAEVAPRVQGLNLHLRNLAFPTEFLASGAFDPSIGFALSAWVDGDEHAIAMVPGLDRFGILEGAYSVTESVPREYSRIDWPDGTRSPGVTLFALFRRRTELSADEFYRRWYAHSGLSLQIHPLTRYHRNAVLRRVAGSGPSWDAIVEERVGVIDDLRPERFYLGEQAREEAVRDLNGFVDLARGDMRCALLEETIIKRPGWLARPGATA